MRILFVTPRVPFPPDRGDKLKVFQLVTRLSRRGHQVSVLCFVNRDDGVHVRDLRRLCRRVHVVPIGLPMSYINCGVATFGSVPFQVAYFSRPKMHAALRCVIDRYETDLVHTHLIRMAQYTRHLTIPTVLDLTDAVSLYLYRMAEVVRDPFRRAFLLDECRRLRAYESVLEEFGRVLVCSDVDRRALQVTAPRARIELLENGIDLQHFINNSDADSSHPSIIYTGNMSYWPNIDGLHYFCSQILPLIREKCPQVSLHVVGQRPPRSVRRLARDPQVIVTGTVPDMRPYYMRATVAVCPIRFKGGTLNKVLEAMAMRVPIVSTSLGIEGLELTPNVEVLVGDTPDAFAAAVLQVLQNSALRQTLTSRAWQVAQQYDWEFVVHRLEQVYDSVLADSVIPCPAADYG